MAIPLQSPYPNVTLHHHNDASPSKWDAVDEGGCVLPARTGEHDIGATGIIITLIGVFMMLVQYGGG